MLRETDYPLPPEFEKAYNASDIVVFETDIGKLHEPLTQQKLLAKAVYADGSTVDKHLSAKAYDELKEYCEAYSIPFQALSQLKPSMLMATLTVIEFRKLGVTQKGVDQFFYELAIRDKKAVEGLETVDEQINYLVSMADDNEDAFVTHSIRASDHGADENHRPADRDLRPGYPRGWMLRGGLDTQGRALERVREMLSFDNPAVFSAEVDAQIRATSPAWSLETPPCRRVGSGSARKKPAVLDAASGDMRAAEVGASWINLEYRYLWERMTR